MTDVTVDGQTYDNRNATGELGPRCKNCSGLGRMGATLGEPNGRSRAGRCRRCGGSGVEPTDVEELARRVAELEDALRSMAARVAELESRTGPGG
jgi:hypothetical protein